MFVVVAIVMVMIVNVYGMTMMTIPIERRFQRIIVFFVMGVTRVYGIKGPIPLLIVIILWYGHRLRNFSRDEELLLLKFLHAFVQFWRHRSRLSVLGGRWYPMQ